MLEYALVSIIAIVYFVIAIVPIAAWFVISFSRRFLSLHSPNGTPNLYSGLPGLLPPLASPSPPYAFATSAVQKGF